MSQEFSIEFSAGTLIWHGMGCPEPLHGLLMFDSRINQYRARGCDYGQIMTICREQGIEVKDLVGGFQRESWRFLAPFSPRPHQLEAYNAWKEHGWRGITAIPTGGGKSFLAMYGIYKLQRSALILVPTIDLLQQWVSQLERFFGVEIGMLGGGSKRIAPITVSTYDSAVIHMEFIGDKFALLICDECHHLGGNIYRTAAEQSIAPYRLGLSATPESDDSERERVLNELLGEVVCSINIGELEGGVLAPYRVESIPVELSESEMVEYEQNRKIYRDFIRCNRINFSAKGGWSQFLIAVARQRDGRAAFRAYLRQREISRQGEAKLAMVWELLWQHAGERVIIFTADNATAYRIGRDFRLPVITHNTKLSERKEMLDSFRCGDYPVLVTSKVLNEGVDVPEASVGIIVSGSASVREHVQRLGRILRSAPDKQAVLYELINADTAEIYTVERRRTHDAYRNKTEL